MSDRRIRLDTARFLDASPLGPDTVRRDDQRRIVEMFLVCCYERVGKAPHLLDGEELERILREHLPASFGRKDPAIPQVLEVLQAFFDHLRDTHPVSQEFELRRALAGAAGDFERAARSRDLPRVPGPASGPMVHRAPKTGRNDPCPCGSGRKFKQCCARLGG